jgi:hypothetical protein
MNSKFTDIKTSLNIDENLWKGSIIIYNQVCKCDEHVYKIPKWDSSFICVPDNTTHWLGQNISINNAKWPVQAGHF